MGADVGLHVGKNILDSFPERSYPARIIQLLNEHKRLGEKSGAGFYKYDARRRAAPDPALAPLVQQSRKVGGRACGWVGGRVECGRGIVGWPPEGQQQHGRCSSRTDLAAFIPPALDPLPPLPCLCVCLPPPRLPSLQGAGLYQEGAPAPKMSDQDIVEFIFFPVVNEGCRVIDEGAPRFLCCSAIVWSIVCLN